SPRSSAGSASSPRACARRTSAASCPSPSQSAPCNEGAFVLSSGSRGRLPETSLRTFFTTNQPSVRHGRQSQITNQAGFFDRVRGSEYPWNMNGTKRIGVLLGGLSAERDVSVRAGEAVLAVLREGGHDALPLFVDRDIDLALRQAHIEVAFLALRGRYGGDGCLQGLLELVGIPYTGSSRPCRQPSPP